MGVKQILVTLAWNHLTSFDQYYNDDQVSISSTFYMCIFRTKKMRVKCWWNWHQNSEVWDGSEHNAFSPRPHHSGREEGVDLRCPDYVSGFDTLASKQGSSTINIEYTLLFLLYMPSMENTKISRELDRLLLPVVFDLKYFFDYQLKS